MKCSLSTLIRTLPTLVIAGAVAGFFAQPAAAQNATGLNCNKCVETGDIAKKAINKSRLKNGTVTGKKIKDRAISESKLDFDVATQAELDDVQAQLDALSLDEGAVVNRLLPKTAFVTFGLFTGDLGGLAGADALCQAAADDPLAIVPDGDYVAWLSTDTVDARDRITQTLGPYVNSRGGVIARSYADLINAMNTELLSRIEWDEFGNEELSSVWTGTNSFGRADPANCSGWTSETPSGGAGYTGFRDDRWTLNQSRDCGATASLYCFQR